MKLFSVLGNRYKLDGGAMFGNAPKAMWERWIPADGLNRIRLATRPVLAVTGKHAILVDAGVGAYMEPKIKDRFGVDESGHVLLKSLEERGFHPEDVTGVILSHLHFDHAGGMLSEWQEGREPSLLFPHAQYYVGEMAWKRATHPNPRDRASFIPTLNRFLEQSGRLRLIRKGDELTFDELTIRFIPSYGHSPGLLCSDMRWDDKRAVFASDLIPGRPWVHLPITMGYDRFPELLIEEKEFLLDSLVKDNGWITFVHDPDISAARVKEDPERHSFATLDEMPECEL